MTDLGQSKENKKQAIMNNFIQHHSIPIFTTFTSPAKWQHLHSTPPLPRHLRD